MSNLVSVVITAYNSEEFISEAIESVLAQTYEGLEVILVDDGSKDSTLSIMKEYQAKDKRIFVIANNTNQGISRSNNIGLEHAIGKFYAKLDSDDIMLPDRIEKQVSFLVSHPEVTMVSCQGYFINSKGKILGLQILPGYKSPDESIEKIKRNELVVCAHTGFTTYLEKIKEVNGYNPNISCVVDVELFTRMAEKGNKLIIMQEPLVKYRVHPRSIVSMKGKSGIMRDTMSLVYENAIRRREGKRELTLEEFKEIPKNESVISRFNLWRKRNSIYHRRMTLIYYGDRAIFKLMYSTFVAMILDPKNVLNKVTSRLKYLSDRNR